MLVPITSIRRGCPNKAGRSNFDKNKIAISRTVKISEAHHYGRLHSNSLGLSNFDCSLTNCEIRHVMLLIVTNIWPSAVLRLDMVDKSTGPLQTHFGPVFSDEAVQTGLHFPE